MSTLWHQPQQSTTESPAAEVDVEQLAKYLAKTKEVIRRHLEPGNQGEAASSSAASTAEPVQKVTKSGIYDALVISLAEDSDADDEKLIPDATTVTESYPAGLEAPPNRLIADGGCRTAVGGEDWHRAYQQLLKSLGKQWTSSPEHEFFRFGAGPIVESRTRYHYPVYLRDNGEEDFIDMSSVVGEATRCPGLASPEEMSRWGIIMRYGRREYQILGSEWKPIECTPSGHPSIKICQEPELPP